MTEQQFKRRLATARREIRKAVERFSEVDALSGHRAEAVRLMREVKDEADKLVREAEARWGGSPPFSNP